MPLTAEELGELANLEDPHVQYIGSSTGGALGGILSIFFKNNSRRDRVVELRTKLRIEELGLNRQEHFNEIYKIRREEEARFDELFNQE